MFRHNGNLAFLVSTSCSQNFKNVESLQHVTEFRNVSEYAHSIYILRQFRSLLLRRAHGMAVAAAMVS